jgi:hypothetical protein
MRGDLQAIGYSTKLPRRIAASATRYEVGEPLHCVGTYTSGAINVNTFVLAAADTPVVGTHQFGGIALSNCLPFSTGTVVSHTAWAACPIPGVGMIRGKAETAANIDTDAELLAILGDAVLIDYAATGATDGGELYTIKDTASADTSGLTIINGNISKGLLDVTVVAAAYRSDWA